MTFQEMFLRNHTMELVAGIVMALVGIVFALWGVWVTQQRVVRFSVRTAWQQHLTLALSGLASEQSDDEVIEFAQQQWLRSQGLFLAGMGTGILLGVAAAFLLLLAMVHVPFGLPWTLEFLFLLPFYWGMVSGLALSGALGFQRTRRLGDDEALTSGEPSHRVSDYRSPLLVLFAAVPFLVYSTMALILAPRYVAFTPDIVRQYGIVPPPQWILAVYSGALLLMVIIAEVCVWIVAKAPAPIRLQNAALAQRFNMVIIRQRMSAIYLFTLIFSPQLGNVGIQLFTPTVQGDEGVGWLLGFWLLLFIVSLIAGLTIQFTSGRMGGRLTGWPWSSGAARDDGEAAARSDGVV